MSYRDPLTSSVPAVGQPGRVVVLNGPDGVDEVPLLSAAREQWRRSGVQVIDLAVTSLPGDRGPFAVDPLLRLLRARLEHFGIPGMIAAIGTVTRLREFHEDDEISSLLGVALRSLFQCITSSRRVVLLVGYTRGVRLHLIADAGSRAGALVVVTCRPGVDMSPGADELFVLVDDVIETGPPPGADRG